MNLRGALGVTLDSADIAQLFGEDQARYLVAAPNPDEVLAAAGITDLSVYGGSPETLQPDIFLD